MSKFNWATIIGVIGVVVENGRRLIIHKRHDNTSSSIHVGVSHESSCKTSRTTFM